VVLDGLQRVDPDMLSVLQPLVYDRELALPDCTRLLRADRYDALQADIGCSKADLTALGILRLHPSFRIVATTSLQAASAASGKSHLLGPSVLGLFACHRVDRPTTTECIQILKLRFPKLGAQQLDLLASLLGSTADITTLSASDASSSSSSSSPSLSNDTNSSSSSSNNAPAKQFAELSLRQVLQLARRIAEYPEDLVSALQRTIMVPLMPPAVRENVLSAIDVLAKSNLKQHDLRPHIDQRLEPVLIRTGHGATQLHIGHVQAPVHNPSNPALVPNIVYYNIPSQAYTMQEMLKDYTIGERHILLIGNQGCGKNRIADRLLQLLGREREYMQLHRDTTVQSLTQSPSIVAGQLQWEDSPLVKAAKYGRVLVLDEVDKVHTQEGHLIQFV
jgi:von Willebrand factor A domain-containing protein 8